MMFVLLNLLSIYITYVENWSSLSKEYVQTPLPNGTMVL